MAFLIFAAIETLAANIVTLTVTVTNVPSSGNVIAISGSRTYSATWGTKIEIGATTGESATNLFEHIVGSGMAGYQISMSSSNIVIVRGYVGASITASLSGSWGTYSLSTQAVTDVYNVAVPMSAMSASQRTNIASLLIADLNSYSTNQIAQSSAIASQLVGITNAQTVSGAKTFTGAVSVSGSGSQWSGGLITNVSLHATNAVIQNATITNGTLQSLATYSISSIAPSGGQRYSGGDATNSAIAIGNDSKAYGGESIAYGVGAEAWGDLSVALGSYAIASNQQAIAIGSDAIASSMQSIAIGANATASGSGSMALFPFSLANGAAGVAIGAYAIAGHSNSFAIGHGAETDTANEIKLGNNDYIVSIDGRANIWNLFVGGTGLIHPSGLNRGVTIGDASGAPTADPTNQVSIWSWSGAPRYRSSGSGEGNGANNFLHNRGGEVVGSGSDYSLTATYQMLDFGGKDPEFNTLPTEGTYLITASIVYTTTSSGYQVACKLYNATAAADIPNSEVLVGTTGQRSQIVLQSIVTTATPSRIQLWGRAPAGGTISVVSTQTKMTYVRLY